MKKNFNYIVKHRLTHSDYNLLTTKIVTLFPKDCVSTYYVQGVPKKQSPHNRLIIAKGRLVDKCRNLLRLNRTVNNTEVETEPVGKVPLDMLDDGLTK